MDLYILFKFWGELHWVIRWVLIANLVMVGVKVAYYLWMLVYVQLTWTEPASNSKPPAFASKRSRGK